MKDDALAAIGLALAAVAGGDPSLTSVFEAWRGIVAEDHAPGQFFGRFTLVVEYASPDSCFGLFCFLLRLAGVPADVIPGVWIEHVRAMGVGGDPDRQEPLRDLWLPAQCAGHRSVVHDIVRAWLDRLRALYEALRSGQPPHALPAAVSAPHIDMARAFLT